MGLEISDGLSTGLRSSLKRSLSRRLVSPMYCLEQWLHCRYACISSLLIKPELHSEIGSYRRESKSFGLLNQISLDVISRTSFHIYKTIHNS